MAEAGSAKSWRRLQLYTDRRVRVFRLQIEAYGLLTMRLAGIIIETEMPP